MDNLFYRMYCGFAILEVLRDSRGEAVDCEFKAVNTAFEELMGLNAEEVVGRKLTDIVPESNAEWINFCGRIASGNLRAKFSTFFQRVGKRLEFVLYSHAEGQVAALITDITLRLKTQAELQQNEEGFRSIAENAPEGIFIAPGFDGPFLYANRCACELTGYSIDELRQIGPAQLVPLDEYPRIKQRMEQRLSGEKVQETYRTNLLRKDGQVTPVEVTGSRAVWRGRPAVLTMMRDVSRYVLKEEELEQWALGFKAEWQESVRTLELKKAELAAQKMNLDRTNREVVKTNTALSVLARNIDRRRESLEKKIAQSISAKIMPVMNDLRSDKLPVKPNQQPEQSRRKAELGGKRWSHQRTGARNRREVMTEQHPFRRRHVVMVVFIQMCRRCSTIVQGHYLGCEKCAVEAVSQGIETQHPDHQRQRIHSNDSFAANICGLCARQ